MADVLMKDSGERQEFTTGAVRDAAEGKPMLSLISPIFIHKYRQAGGGLDIFMDRPLEVVEAYEELLAYLEGNREEYYLINALRCLQRAYDISDMEMLNRLGNWLTLGAQKYSARNWEKGIPLCRTFDSLLRHFFALVEGKTDEDHFAAFCCNCMFIIHTEEMVRRGLLPVKLYDLPNYTVPEE